MFDEQIDVAIDQIEPALVGFASEARRDDDDLAVGDLGHVAGGDALIPGQACPVQQIERLPSRLIRIGVDQTDTADDAAHLQGVRRRAADQSAAADDGDFHEFTWSNLIVVPSSSAGT